MWRQATWAALFSPILIGSLLFVGVLIVWKLPMVCCERFRAVRYLPLGGLCYYSVAVTVATVSLGLEQVAGPRCRPTHCSPARCPHPATRLRPLFERDAS